MFMWRPGVKYKIFNVLLIEMFSLILLIFIKIKIIVVKRIFGVLGSWYEYKHTKPIILSWTERFYSHMGIEIRPCLCYGDCSGEYWAMVFFD